MKQGSFVIGKQFLIDPKIDQLFKNIHAESKETREDVVKYVGVSNLFNELKGTGFKIGYKGGEFKAFEESAEITEDAWIDLSDPKGSFSGIKIPKEKTSKKVVKKVSKISYNELYDKAVKAGFIAKEHKDRKTPTLLKYLAGLDAELVTGLPKDEKKKEEKPGPSEVIKTYEVLKEESVKNASGFLDVGSIINESQEFETPFGKMLKDGSIKEVKE